MEQIKPGKPITAAFFAWLMVLVLFHAGAARADRCGDGVCQGYERRRGSCPADCAEAQASAVSPKSQETQGSQGSGSWPRLAGIRFMEGRGGRVDWLHGPEEWIAFDRIGKDKRFNVYIMRPDGSGMKCVTCGHPDLPGRTAGQPAWHPSGRYLIFQAEKKEHPRASLLRTNPGSGHYNDIWLLDMRTNKAVPLVTVPLGKDFGTLHPHFSDDGTKLSWSEMYETSSIRQKDKFFGYWKLKVADFSVGPDGRPVLSNVREYAPGDPAFYENHGFSPDGRYLLFSSNFKKGVPVKTRNDIFRLDLSDGSVLKMTEEAYNEHAIFSPDGRRIVWMTSRDNANEGTDYWAMNPDGSGKKRLTFFNQEGHPQHFKKRLNVADFAWSPDGKRIFAYAQDMGGIADAVFTGVDEMNFFLEVPST